MRHGCVGREQLRPRSRQVWAGVGFVALLRLAACLVLRCVCVCVCARVCVCTREGAGPKSAVAPLRTFNASEETISLAWVPDSEHVFANGAGFVGAVCMYARWRAGAVQARASGSGCTTCALSRPRPTSMRTCVLAAAAAARALDVVTMDSSLCVVRARQKNIRGVRFDPLRPHCLATFSDDSVIKWAAVLLAVSARAGTDGCVCLQAVGRARVS